MSDEMIDMTLLLLAFPLVFIITFMISYKVIDTLFNAVSRIMKKARERR